MTVTEYPVAPNPVRTKDHFPMLFYSGETVVEIKMIEASVLEGDWIIELGTILEKAPAKITKVVFEGPEGCYEANVLVPKGSNFKVVAGPRGATWFPCDRG